MFLSRIASNYSAVADFEMPADYDYSQPTMVNYRDKRYVVANEACENAVRLL